MKPISPTVKLALNQSQRRNHDTKKSQKTIPRRLVYCTLTSLKTNTLHKPIQSTQPTMPLPVIVAGPAAGAFCAGAAAATKHMVMHAAVPFMDVTTLSSATLAAWLLRYFWKNKVPAWAKEDVSFQNLLRRKSPLRSSSSSAADQQEFSNDASDSKSNLTSSQREEGELSNLSSVLEKLQALMDSVHLGDDHPSMLQQHAALLAFVQLSAQLKKQEQQQQQTVDGLKGPATNEEEKKEEHAPTSPSTSTDKDGSAGETWASRDALYESAEPSPATLSNIPKAYFEFAEHPEQPSPLHTTLQQALNFATWAYYEDTEVLSDKLENEDFELLEHSRASRPGHVAYYMAVSSITKKQLVIGLRGTSTLEDIVTDCCGRPVPLDDRPYYYDHDRGSRLNRSTNHQDPSCIEVKAASPDRVVHQRHDRHSSSNNNKHDGTGEYEGGDSDENGVELISGHERIWVEEHAGVSITAAATGADETANRGGDTHLPKCHEGIMLSAKRVVDKVQEQIEHWCVQRGYQLVLCGHSLGAGCASLAAVLLRSRLPELTHDNPVVTSEAGGDSPRMQVWCFAPPPVLDREAALAASSYCTSVVNNADVITRCSLENLFIFLEVLKGIWKELIRQELAPTGAKTTAAFFRRMAQGTEGELLLPARGVRRLMKEAKEKIQSIESRELLNQEIYDDDIMEVMASGSGSLEGGWVEVQGGGRTISNPTPLYIPGIVLLAYEPWQASDQSIVGDQACGPDDVDAVDVDPVSARSPMSWRVTDGLASALNFLEMDASSRMAVDHATTSYYTLLGLDYEF